MSKVLTLNGNVLINNGNAVLDPETGGGQSSSVTEKDVNFIDYDGTLLYSYTVQEFSALSSLPENPSHEGLTAQGWNWTKEQITTQLTATPTQKIWVGQMYVTSSGKTEIDIALDDSNLLSPYLKIAVNGTVEVDWGDGSSKTTVTGASLTSGKYSNHTYSVVGNYTICIDVISGSFAFNSSYILSDKTSTGNSSKRYNQCIYNIRLGNDVVISSSYIFAYCNNLYTITIPNSISSIGSNAFYQCFSLKSITIPNGITSFGSYFLSNCSSLQSIAIPSGITSINGYAFYQCFSLKSITIPSSITTIDNALFSNCYSLKAIEISNNISSISNTCFYNNYSLKTITIPSGITTIGTSAFQNCYSLYKIVFKSTTPPTVTNSNAFSGLLTDCIISVPTGTLSAYTSATNYPSSSTYTYIEE